MATQAEGKSPLPDSIGTSRITCDVQVRAFGLWRRMFLAVSIAAGTVMLGMPIARFATNHRHADTRATDEGLLYPIKVNGRLGLIDKSGEVVIEPTFTYPDSNEIGFSEPATLRHFRWSDGMAIVWKNGKAGYVNTSGEVVVEPRFEKAGNFYDGFAFALDRTDGIVVLNKRGRVAQRRLEDVRRPHEGLAAVKKHGWWGIMNLNNGLFTAKPIYSEAHKSFGTYYTACINEAWGIIDKAGNTILPIEYDYIRSVSDSLAVVHQGGKYGIYNMDARAFSAPIAFEAIGVYSEGLLEFWKEKKVGFIDVHGNIMVQPEYDVVYRFHGRRTWGVKGTQHYYIDQNGRVLAAPDCDGVSSTVDGYSVIYRWEAGPRETRGRKCAVIDPSGTLIVPFHYDFIRDYSKGRAVVRLDGRSGLIDERGREIVSPSLDFIREFRDGMAVAGRGDLVGLLGRDGQWICEPQYEDLGRVSAGLRLARIPNKERSSYVGYTNAEGKLLFSSTDWGYGEYFLGDIASIKTASQGDAYVNREGKVVWSIREHSAHR